ncbi:MFS, tetracycline-resistance protein [Bifidobacterium dolichotidis]|uniref:Tetracycline resistance protein n=1 Tax=Bifidobacterium dolichotidis TaxID=2306976 RepID=A0A430FPX9_9BIFI|nr:MFS transporter [Bifidobacterium dolichotidis]RSX54876.1 MFS, tetracycline-resistance protein [Bifidobacterium dolichotidis]
MTTPSAPVLSSDESTGASTTALNGNNGGKNLNVNNDNKNDAAANNETANRARKTLFPLLGIYLLGALCLQAFNMVFAKIGSDLGAATNASLITAIPGVVLAIVCFIYGSLGDFASLKTMTVFGIIALVFGSVGGFFMHESLILVIIFRIIQTIGFQTAGSVYLVVVARYLTEREKLLYFGLFTADYQLATAIGVVSAGVFSAIDWKFLFLIPVVAVVFLIPLIKYLPGKTGGKTHIDVPGFGLFGMAILFLTLFFSVLDWWMLAVSAAFLVLFAIYISKATDPFVTPAFFKNVPWRESVLLIVIFYFINFAITPLCNDFGAALFGMSSTQVSLMLLPGLIIATITGCFSGRIVSKLGKRWSITLGAGMMAAGFILGGLFLRLGPILIGFCAALIYAGMATIYSPTANTVLGTLPPEQTGRGVGMNDLAMQGSGAVGIALFGGPISAHAFGWNTVLGPEGAYASSATMLILFGVIVAVGVLWLQLHHKKFYHEN